MDRLPPSTSLSRRYDSRRHVRVGDTVVFRRTLALVLKAVGVNDITIMLFEPGNALVHGKPVTVHRKVLSLLRPCLECCLWEDLEADVKAWSQTKQFVEKLDEVKKDSSLLENIIRNTPYLRVQYDILIQRSEPERDMLYKNQVEHLYDLAFVSFIL